MSNRRARRIAAWVVWCCLGAALGACAAPGPDDLSAEAVTAEAAALSRAEERASAVHVLDSGHWSQYVYHGITRESFWVDLSVRNDSPTKEVGIVWSTNGGMSWQRSLASYEGTLADGRERWGVDVRDFGSRGWGSEPEVEYAAFVTMNGATQWSPYRNHFIYRGVTPDAPVRLLSSRVSWDGSVARLEGVVRGLRTASERRVFVRYTLDGWATWSEVQAQPQDGEHGFSIPLALDPATTHEVVFAVRFESGGEHAWDNNAGADYRHQLAPVVFASLANAPGYAADGILMLNGSARTVLPISEIRVRLDGGAWEALPSGEVWGTYGGFDASGAFRRIYETRGLAAGVHPLEVEVTAGPFVRYATALELDVADAIEHVGTTRLPDVDRGTTWDVDRGPDGQLVVAYERGLVRLDKAATSAELVFETHEALTYLNDVEATTDYVFALEGLRVVRFDATSGAVDRAFGANGILDLRETSYEGTALCWASHLAANDDAFFVTDSCNARLLRFTHDGAYVDQVAFGTDDGSWSNVQLPVVHGDAVWIVRHHFVEGQQRHELVAIAATPDAPLAEVERVMVDARIGSSPQGFAVAGDSVWVATSDDFHLLARDGALRATWLGAGLWQPTVPGAISLGEHVEAFADGSAQVLSVQNGTLERFAARR